jgi:TonB-dependent receptor
VQAINTDQSSTSRVADNTANVMRPFTDGKTYTDVLPSVNLAFSFANEQTVRLGVGQQMARPRMDQMSAALNFSIDAATRKPSGSGGNPRLDPWRANAYDISYEKYFAKKGYVAVAGFYKDLKTYIYNFTVDNHDFGSLTNGTSASPIGSYTAPFNGHSGSLKGVEFTASIPFDLISPELSGFGVMASTSATTSGIVIQDPSSQVGANIPLPGLSKNVSNLTLYYEKSGFSARVSQRTRSDFVGEITTYDGSRVLKYVVGESIVDGQVGYSFETGNFKGLGFTLQVNNINDTAYKTYSGTRDKPLDYIKYGRTVLLGANYKF